MRLGVRWWSWSVTMLGRSCVKAQQGCTNYLPKQKGTCENSNVVNGAHQLEVAIPPHSPTILAIACHRSPSPSLVHPPSSALAPSCALRCWYRCPPQLKPLPTQVVGMRRTAPDQGVRYARAYYCIHTHCTLYSTAVTITCRSTEYWKAVIHVYIHMYMYMYIYMYMCIQQHFYCVIL